MRRGRKTEADLARHTERRARERYGIELGLQEQRRLAQRIQRGGRGAVHLRRLSGYRSLWLLYWREIPLIAVYDKRRRCLRTILESRYSREYRAERNRGNGQTYT